MFRLVHYLVLIVLRLESANGNTLSKYQLCLLLDFSARIHKLVEKAAYYLMNDIVILLKLVTIEVCLTTQQQAT